MHPLARLDHRYLWHPFTQMRDWLRAEPIVIVEGEGPELIDAYGKRYLDANASIWTNLHGHRHPGINAAITAQLGKIAHSSALGVANEPAALLGERLVNLATEGLASSRQHRTPAEDPSAEAQETPEQPELTKVFFSDDGSTAMEVAIKLAYETARRSGIARPRFLSVDGAYHGDTVGAVSVGHIDLFHRTWSGLLFKTATTPAPYCYRCPHNQARPERADARDYRKCQWECVSGLEEQFETGKLSGEPVAGFVVEPLMQGAAGMVPQPPGWLRKAAEIARSHGAMVIADEVMTGFGRTGGRSPFACHQEGVQPDFLAVAKGLTGGYLPMAATLTTNQVFEAFLGEYEEFKTFFHGHSFTGNQLGAAAALASLGLLQTQDSIQARENIASALRSEIGRLWDHPHVGDIRVAGTVAGIELVKDWTTRETYDLRQRMGIRVCEALARRGVLTRPIGNVIPLILPYCFTEEHVARTIGGLAEAIQEITSA